MNPGASHFFVNRASLTNQLYPDGSVARTDEKNDTEFDRIILQYTRRGDVVVDLCCGTGSVGVACARLGRRFIGYFFSLPLSDNM